MHLVRTLLVVAISLVSVSPPFTSLAADTSADQKDAQDELTEAIAEIKSYSVEQRDAALERADAILEDLDVRIDGQEDRLRQDWNRMSEAARAETTETLSALREKRDTLAQWYGGLQHGSSSAWEDIKKGFSDAYSDLEKAWDDATSERAPDN